VSGGSVQRYWQTAISAVFLWSAFFDFKNLNAGSCRELEMQPNLVISVKEARKILGKKSENMTDDEIEAMIATLQSIAEPFLVNNGS